MYLMDVITATAALAGPGREDHPVLKVFPQIVERMRHAPRYLLDASVMQASIEIGLGRPSIFREAMRHLRVPYSAMWIEWEETSRGMLRDRLHESVIDPTKPLPARLGFLIEADPGGRQGMVTWAWVMHQRSADYDLPGVPVVPNISPFHVYFDLDRTVDQDDEMVQGLSLGQLARMWQDNPVQHEALLDIWRTSRHVAAEWGRPWMQESRQRYFLADIYGEYIGIWSIMLLLTAARPTVEYKEVDLSRLNRARAKARKVPLLDYAQVTMHIDRRTVAEQRRQPLGYARKSPRIHMVSRYLNRRGDKHWIVEPFIRGSGGPVERRVHVTR